MAIRVVGEDAAQVRRTTCPSCAAVLEYTLADTSVETVKDYLGDADTYRRLKCPRCSVTMTVPMY